MLYPEIEKLSTKCGNQYVLTCLVGKRAKQLEKMIPEVIENSPEKAISLAAREIEAGKIVPSSVDEIDN